MLYGFGVKAQSGHFSYDTRGSCGSPMSVLSSSKLTMFATEGPSVHGSKTLNHKKRRSYHKSRGNVGITPRIDSDDCRGHRHVYFVLDV